MTIYDIATHLGVSPATVSLALNGDTRVAEKTRERVLAYTNKVGFKRNEQARNFRLKRSNNVALVVHNIDNDFWSGIVRSIEETLGEPYNVILCNTEADIDKEKKILKNLLRRKVDGLIIQPASKDESMLLEIIVAGVPVVSLEETENKKISFVKGDDYRSAFNLVHKCIDRGHRKIAFLSFKLESIGLDERLRGFKDAIDKAGLIEQCESFFAEEISIDAIDAVIGNRICDFSLVIASDDRLACRLLQLLKIKGIDVPEEISVFGWNNSPFLEYLTPSLSSVGIPMAEIGKRGAEIILKSLNGKDTVAKDYIDEEILFRDSFKNQP